LAQEAKAAFGAQSDSDEDEDADALNGFNLKRSSKKKETEDDLDATWDDWQEEDDEGEEIEIWEKAPLTVVPLSRVTCLFCQETFVQMEDLFFHMNAGHEFDFHHLRNYLKLDFYRQVKLINYIRRQVHLQRCLFCNERCNDRLDLLTHMNKTNHLRPPEDVSEWDRPDFLFPVYEDDGLLCRLEDVFDAQGEISIYRKKK